MEQIVKDLGKVFLRHLYKRSPRGLRELQCRILAEKLIKTYLEKTSKSAPLKELQKLLKIPNEELRDLNVKRFFNRETGYRFPKFKL